MRTIEISEKAFQVIERLRRSLNQISGKTIFSGMNKSGNTQDYFSALHYEAITVEIQQYLDQLGDLNSAGLSKIKSAFLNLKQDPKFQSHTKGGGENYAAALRQRIEFVEKWVEKCLQQIPQQFVRKLRLSANGAKKRSDY
jgi:hypothetical protein